MSAEEYTELVTTMSRELSEYRTVSTFGVAFGRKPQPDRGGLIA